MVRSVLGLRLRRRDEGDRRQAALRRAYERGFDARMKGRPCQAPDDYEIKLGFDLVGEWIAGWARADRELDEQDARDPDAEQP